MSVSKFKIQDCATFQNVRMAPISMHMRAIKWKAVKLWVRKKVGEEDFLESDSKCKEGNDGLKRKKWW